MSAASISAKSSGCREQMTDDGRKMSDTRYFLSSVICRPSSESLHGLLDVLHFRRRREAVADEAAPCGKIRGAAKIDGVVLQRFPLHEQPVARGLLDRSLKRHPRA